MSPGRAKEETPMDYGVEHFGNVVKVSPHGRLDSATADRFVEHLGTVIASGGRNLVIDFRDVKYITSAGFRCLLIAAVRIRAAEGRMALTGMAQEVLRLFEMGAFTENFTILGTVEECVGWFADPASA